MNISTKPRTQSNEYFNAIVKEHDTEAWELLSKIIDPACYWDHIEAVDDHHFPGIHSENSPFSHLGKKFTNAREHVNDHSILKTKHAPTAKARIAMKQEGGKTQHLIKRGYARFSLAVREAVFKQILPTVVRMGMNPKFDREVKKSVIDGLSK